MTITQSLVLTPQPRASGASKGSRLQKNLPDSTGTGREDRLSSPARRPGIRGPWSLHWSHALGSGTRSRVLAAEARAPGARLVTLGRQDAGLLPLLLEDVAGLDFGSQPPPPAPTSRAASRPPRPRPPRAAAGHPSSSL